MENPVLLKKVLSDYCAQNEELHFQEEIIRAFCDYTEDWLRRNGVIGVGQTAEGLALRMSDGTEYALFQPVAEIKVSAPVSITGSATKIEKPVNDFTRSFPITGK